MIRRLTLVLSDDWKTDDEERGSMKTGDGRKKDDEDEAEDDRKTDDDREIGDDRKADEER